MEAALLNAVAANGTGPVLDLGLDGITDDLSIQITVTGSVSAFSVQLNGSDDGVNFAALGSAVTAAGLTKVSTSTTGPIRFVQAVLTGLTGAGTLTATVAAAADA